MEEIGSIKIANKNIRFLIKESKGKTFGHIRDYSNHGKGVELTRDDMGQILDILNELSVRDITVIDEKEIFRKEITDGFYLIVRLRYTRGKLHIDFRYYYDEVDEFGKQGVNIPFERLDDVIHLMKLMIQKWDESR